MIQLKNLERSYKTPAGQFFVLRRVNLEIREGEFITVMGPSGAGKSSLLNVLALLDDAWQGEYWFGEQPVHLMKRKDRFDYIMIETTGLANPGPVAQTFFVDDEMQRKLALDGIVTVVDALHIWQHLDDSEEARPFGQEPGTFTPWEDIPENTDVMFYEGLHGGVVTEEVNVAQHVDLLIGVVPVINLEWIQKLNRDKAMRGYSTEAVTDTILRRA